MVGLPAEREWTFLFDNKIPFKFWKYYLNLKYFENITFESIIFIFCRESKVENSTAEGLFDHYIICSIAFRTQR
jgi:hypothetical protein